MGYNLATGIATCDVCSKSSILFCPGCAERQDRQKELSDYYKMPYEELKAQLDVYPNSVHGICWGYICRACAMLPQVPELLWLWQQALVPITFGSGIHTRKRSLHDPYHNLAYKQASDAGHLR